jgi:hypothetical protein
MIQKNVFYWQAIVVELYKRTRLQDDQVVPIASNRGTGWCKMPAPILLILCENNDEFVR